MPPTVEKSGKIDDVFVVRLQAFGDDRGYFNETYRKTWIPGTREMVQGNCSFSKAGVLRGMHYHLKQADLWSVPVGRVWAVLCDLRASSATRGVSQGFAMGRENPIGLYIPKGVAHGFYAREDSYMTYLVDEYYDGADELGVLWNDPALGLDWGGAKEPNLSPRDAQNPLLAAIPVERRPK
jgi:dTDP-4-dehydrorhamnose 3,5-epimerase